LNIEMRTNLANVTAMNEATTVRVGQQEARHKAQAGQYLAEAQRILRRLAAERRRSSRQNPSRASLTEEVKAILQGA
jgi:hypothetical protein